MEALLITFSGVIIPGPVTALTISKGMKSPHVGAMVALGHGLVEIPLMMFILFGFGEILKMTVLKMIISLIGGYFLFRLSLNLMKGIKNSDSGDKPINNSRSPLADGMMLTLVNPAYLTWIATLGSILIMRAYTFGISGVVIYLASHWMMDIFWLYFLSALSFKGGQFFGQRIQKILFAVCGIFLLFFSAKFIYDALKMIMNCFIS